MAKSKFGLNFKRKYLSPRLKSNFVPQKISLLAKSKFWLRIGLKSKPAQRWLKSLSHAVIITKVHRFKVKYKNKDRKTQNMFSSLEKRHTAL